MDREALSQSQQPDKPQATKDLRIPREDWLTNIGARIPIAALHDLMVRPSECARCFVSLQEPAGADILVVGALCTKPPPSTLTLAIAAVVVVSHSRYYLSVLGTSCRWAVLAVPFLCVYTKGAHSPCLVASGGTLTKN
jgi:hypothetical protein